MKNNLDHSLRYVAKPLCVQNYGLPINLYPSVKISRNTRKSKYEPLHEKANNVGFRPGTNRPVQSKKPARSLKFRI